MDYDRFEGSGLSGDKGQASAEIAPSEVMYICINICTENLVRKTTHWEI